MRADRENRQDNDINNTINNGRATTEMLNGVP